jgi:hypothetical protein
MEKTQLLAVTQDICSPSPHRLGLARLKSASLPPSEPDDNSFQSITSSGIDTQVLKNQLISAAARNSGTDDSEMLG